MRYYLKICRLVGEVFAVAQVDISRYVSDAASPRRPSRRPLNS